MLSTMGRALTTLVAVGALITGCSLDQTDYNYVQPGAYVEKAELEGKSWYYRRTVVDTKAGASFQGIGSGDWLKIERVRFDIQENQIIGYRDYELVPGTEEGKYEDADFTEFGTPYVVIPVKSHFDIQRNYNSATGEETNVVARNTSDRPWHEREYMDLDWGGIDNIMSRMFFETTDIFGMMARTDRLVAHPDDAANPFRARVDVKNGYMDVVINHFLVPDLYDCWDRGFSSPLTCGSGQEKIRHSFMMVDEEKNAGYEKLHYPDTVPLLDDEGNEIVNPETNEVLRAKVFDRFGFFRIERTTYDEVRGTTQSGLDHSLIRFDIWDSAYNADGTMIPHAERTPAPIHYYLNWDFPADLLSTAMEVGGEWNGVFKRTVASLQDKDVSEVPDMFILHENTCNTANLIDYLGKRPELQTKVQDYVCGAWDETGTTEVPANCNTASLADLISHTTLSNFCSTTEYFTQNQADDRFLWEQIGDNRFNMLVWIDQITDSQGWSGYGPMFGDPTNGRNVVSSAYLLGWTIERRATRALEYIDYINGKLTLAEIIQGASVPSGYSSSEFNPGTQLEDMRRVQEASGRQAAAEHMLSLERRFSEMGSGPEETMTELENGNHFHERLARMEGTEMESEWLLRDEDYMMASMMAWEPNTEFDPMEDPMGFFESLEWSPASGADPHPAVREKASHLSRVRDFEEHIEPRMRAMQERTYCPMANLDNSLVGLAEELKDMPREEALLYLKQSLFKGVALHEVGHNVGLHHNWEGSYDSLNYHKDFWELETSGLDEATKLAERQPEYKFSTVMDYPGMLNGRMQGLGLYDEAAIKFGYGQLIETFNTGALDGGKDLRRWRLANDYKKLPEHMGGVDSIYDRKDVRWDWNSTEGVTQSSYEALIANEVPYLFCAYYSNYTPSCLPFDYGANHREIQAGNRVTYKNYFIFRNFLRNRATMSRSALWRGYYTFAPILKRYQWMYYYRANQDKLFDKPFFETDLGQDLAAATADGLNLMAEVIGMPEPGRYYRCEDESGQPFYYPSWYISFSALDQDDATTPVGYGFDRETCVMNPYTNSTIFEPGHTQPMFLGLTDDFTEWDFSYFGTYWDKDWALTMLAQPRAWFPRYNRSDITNYIIPFTRLYEDEIYNVMSSMITGKRKLIGSSYNEELGTFVPRQLVDMSSSLDLVGNDTSTADLATVVAPMTTNLQRYALLYGMALMTSPFDANLDFAKHTRVTLKGAFDDVGFFGDEFTVAECTMPDSGLTYRASTLDSKYDISYEMVEKCAYFVSELEVVNYDMVEAKRDDRDAAWQAWHADDDNEALRTQYLTIDQEYDELAWRYSTARNGLTRLGQQLQFARLVHRYYEH